VRKDMKNVRIAFKILNGEESIPPTYQEIHCHMIFDVKMEDFMRKARFVAGGHTTDTPHAMTVNTSGKAGAQIPQLPLGDDSSPWGR
jgi:hypothetical protein